MLFLQLFTKKSMTEHKSKSAEPRTHLRDIQLKMIIC